jgi:hypothetical protein
MLLEIIIIQHCHRLREAFALIDGFAVLALDFTEEWGFGILAAKPTQTSG